MINKTYYLFWTVPYASSITIGHLKTGRWVYSVLIMTLFDVSTGVHTVTIPTDACRRLTTNSLRVQNIPNIQIPIQSE